jgi:hypothetical protein
MEWDDTDHLVERVREHLRQNVRICGNAVLVRLAAPAVALWGSARDQHWHEQSYVVATRMVGRTPAPALYMPIERDSDLEFPDHQRPKTLRALAKEADRFEREDLRATSLLSIASFLGSADRSVAGKKNDERAARLRELTDRHDAESHDSLDEAAAIIAEFDLALFPGKGRELLEAVVDNWVGRPVAVAAFMPSP